MDVVVANKKVKEIETSKKFQILERVTNKHVSVRQFLLSFFVRRFTLLDQQTLCELAVFSFFFK